MTDMRHTMSPDEEAEWVAAMASGGQRGYALANGVGDHDYVVKPRVRATFAPIGPVATPLSNEIVDALMRMSR